jgi:hypothetical protein
VGLEVVLLLVAASAAVQLLVEGSDFARLVLLWLQALTLIAAVRSSDAKRALVRLATWVAAFAALVAVAVFVVTGDMPKAPVGVVNGLLVGVAPVVIGAGLVRKLRREQTVAINTLAGVLAIYLLSGMFFSFVYSVIAAVDSDALFGAGVVPSVNDQLYFSYVTLSTVGYGDLSPAADLPRAIAVLEMLAGQIYLVTVVALIVGHLGHSRPVGSRP